MNTIWLPVALAAFALVLGVQGHEIICGILWVFAFIWYGDVDQCRRWHHDDRH